MLRTAQSCLPYSACACWGDNLIPRPASCVYILQTIKIGMQKAPGNEARESAGT